MKIYHEFMEYIPPHVTVNDDGSIDPSEWDEVYKFDRSDRFLLSFTGMGMPPIDYIEQQGPDQHGVTFLGYRLQARTVQLVHRRNAGSYTTTAQRESQGLPLPDASMDRMTAPTTRSCGRFGYWAARHEILNRLRPNSQVAQTFGLGRLRARLPGNIIRDLDVLIQRGPIFQARSLDIWDEWSFTEALRFVAPDPTFYDPEQKTQTFSQESDGGVIFYEAVTHPDTLELPEGFVGELIDNTEDLVYIGEAQDHPTWHSYPIIEITGPINNPIITNETTGDTIEFEYNVSAGEVVTVSLLYGNKSITNDSDENLIGVTTPESNIATFKLAASPEAPRGVNQITVTGTGIVAGTTEVTLKWYWRYIGI